MSKEIFPLLTVIIVLLGVVALWLQNRYYKRQSYNMSKEFADKRIKLFVEYLTKLRAIGSPEFPLSLDRAKSGILEGVNNLNVHYEPTVSQINKDKVDFILAQLKMPVKDSDELFDILIDKLSNWEE